MVEGTDFCPYCRAPRTPASAPVCATCGRALPAPPAVPPPSPAPAPSVPPVRRPVLSSWAELRSILRVTVYVVAGWLVASAVVGLTFGHAVANGVGADHFQALDLRDFDVKIAAAHIAMFSSLLAGLGIRVFTSGGILTLSVVPIGSLTLLALLARSGARRALRRNPPSSLSDMFVRITLGAAIAALSVNLISSLAILVWGQTVQPPTGPLAPETTALSANATADGLYFVLFPALWIGCAAGVFSLAPARALFGRVLSRRVDAQAARVLGLVGTAGVAVRAYLLTVVAISPLVVLGWAFFVLTNGQSAPDVLGVAFSLPAVLAMAPNAVLVLALGATGSVMNYGAGGLPSDIALWQADKGLIAAGLVSLVAPALAAGLVLGRRRPGAGPGEVGLAGIIVGIVALLLVNIAAASVNDGAVSAAAVGGSGSAVNAVTRLSFDLGQASLVGGAVVLVLVVLGFVLGMAVRGAPATQQQSVPMPSVPRTPVLGG